MIAYIGNWSVLKERRGSCIHIDVAALPSISWDSPELETMYLAICGVVNAFGKHITPVDYNDDMNITDWDGNPAHFGDS